MSSLSLTQQSADSPFDSIRKEDSDGEFWSARELQDILGYGKWQKFKAVIDAARENVESVASNGSKHFLPVEVKSQGRPSLDYHLSRLAAYHVALACDARGNDQVKAAKHYFAIKTREAEIIIPAQNDRIRELELEIQLRHAETGKFLAEQKVLDTRRYITEALPEHVQQKILGYQLVEKTEYRDRVIHDEDLVRDGSTVNKTTLCKRLKFFTKTGKPDFKKLNNFLVACQLPESAWQLTASLQENLELTRDAAAEVERRWFSAPIRDLYIGE